MLPHNVLELLEVCKILKVFFRKKCDMIILLNIFFYTALHNNLFLCSTEFLTEFKLSLLRSYKPKNHFFEFILVFEM